MPDKSQVLQTRVLKSKTESLRLNFGTWRTTNLKKYKSDDEEQREERSDDDEQREEQSDDEEQMNDLTTKNKDEMERKNAGRLESSNLHEKERWTNSEDCKEEEVKLES